MADDDKQSGNIVKFPDAKKGKRKTDWRISYKARKWGSGDGSPVGLQSSGNSGSHGGREPFLNIGRVPPFAKYMALSLVAVHFIMAFILPASVVWDVRMKFAFIPGVFTGSEPMLSLFSLLSPFTHMMLHAEWMHVLVNAAMMLVFGFFVETRLGSKVAVFFFLIGGFIGSAFYFALNPMTSVQLLGASSGISALFGVTLLALHAERAGQMGSGLMAGRPWKMVTIWTAIMIGLGLLGGGDIAWQAHVGGFLGGIFLYRLMQRGVFRI